MKLNYIKYACAALPLLGLTACLDFDTPSDEFVKGSDVIVDPTPLFGDADNLEITEVTEEEVDEARRAQQQFRCIPHRPVLPCGR